MTSLQYRDAQLEGMLLKSETDDSAFSYLVKEKRNLARFIADAEGKPSFKGEIKDMADYYQRMLSDIPLSMHCRCCGLEITRIHRRGNYILGSECQGHFETRFPCRGAKP